MLHCYEGHDVHELYSKLDFRCDCGNSKMPLACHIDGSMPPEPSHTTITNAKVNTNTQKTATALDNNKVVFEGKANSNDQNVYNMTYYDIYCICK